MSMFHATVYEMVLSLLSLYVCIVFVYCSIFESHSYLEMVLAIQRGRDISPSKLASRCYLPSSPIGT
jgi:hypothetical protein